jgi:hypothetical protein
MLVSTYLFSTDDGFSGEVTNTPIHPFKVLGLRGTLQGHQCLQGLKQCDNAGHHKGAVLAFDWRSSKLGTGFGVPPTAIDSPSPSENPLPSSRKHHITGIGDEHWGPSQWQFLRPCWK